MLSKWMVLVVAAITFTMTGTYAPPVTAADDMERTYTIKRNGSKIGTLTHKVTRRGDSLTFESDTRIAVKELDITLYHRDNKFRSVWHKGELESFSSDTDIQGKNSHIAGIRHGDRLVITGPDGTADAPNKSIPNTYWNIATVDATHLINKENGAIQEIDISKVQSKDIMAGGKKVEAQHFLMTGGQNQSLYYDDGGTWLGTVFRHSGGNLIEIVLE
ncbi:MAG: hypothetical protein GY791_13820 [Alphaproteobacteria bacterium]|nr:hypothetical protein [Alphaproteobacteria bacterium]